MRFLVDLFRKFVSKTDSFLIYSFGKDISYYEPIVVETSTDPTYLEDRVKQWSSLPQMLYGVCEILHSDKVSVFGIDSPNELVISLNYESVLNKLGRSPKIGARLVIKNENWIVLQRVLVDDLWGEYRLRLLCEPYVVSETVGKCTNNADTKG